jgi:hypothetical protein
MSGYKDFIESNLKINDKKANIVPYILNPLQCMLDRDIIEERANKVIILKARQMGCSVFIMTIFLLDCLKQKSHVGIMAHKDVAAKELLNKMRALIRNMVANGFNIPLQKCNDHSIEFKQTGSTVNAVTANSPDLFRSTTLTHLHLSEAGYYTRPEEMIMASQNAMAEGTKIIMESTANGFNYFKEFYYFQKNETPPIWKTLFYGWFLMPEYELSIDNYSEVFELNDEEKQYVESVYNETGIELTLQKMLWRRNKIISTFSSNPVLFNQEFPYCERVAFINSGGMIFSKVFSYHNEKFGADEIGGRGCLRLKEHPKKNCNYVFGVDSSGGTGKDFSAIVGLCLETGEQVFQYQYNYLDPLEFAKYVGLICRHYNQAFVVVESNSHGLSVLAYLKSYYIIGKIYKRSVEVSLTRVDGIPVKYGWETQEKTLKLMIDTTKELTKETVKIYSNVIVSQLAQYSEDYGGRIIVSSKHQDVAMAFMLSCIGYQHYKNKVVENMEKVTVIKEKTFDYEKREVNIDFFNEGW